MADSNIGPVNANTQPVSPQGSLGGLGDGVSFDDIQESNSKYPGGEDLGQWINDILNADGGHQGQHEFTYVNSDGTTITVHMDSLDDLFNLPADAQTQWVGWILREASQKDIDTLIANNPEAADLLFNLIAEGTTDSASNQGLEFLNAQGGYDGDGVGTSDTDPSVFRLNSYDADIANNNLAYFLTKMAFPEANPSDLSTINPDTANAAFILSLSPDDQNALFNLMFKDPSKLNLFNADGTGWLNSSMSTSDAGQWFDLIVRVGWSDELMHQGLGDDPGNTDAATALQFSNFIGNLSDNGHFSALNYKTMDYRTLRGTINTLNTLHASSSTLFGVDPLSAIPFRLLIMVVTFRIRYGELQTDLLNEQSKIQDLNDRINYDTAMATYYDKLNEKITSKGKIDTSNPTYQKNADKAQALRDDAKRLGDDVNTETTNVSQANTEFNSLNDTFSSMLKRFADSMAEIVTRFA